MIQNIKNNTQSTANGEEKQNSLTAFSAISIGVVSIVALGLILMLFNSISWNSGIHGMNGNNMMGYQTAGLGLTAVLQFLLKLLLFVSLAGVIVGTFMFVKQNYSKQITESIGTFKINDKHTTHCPKCQSKVSDEFKHCPDCGEKLKQGCASCGAELKPDWKCCPDCGVEKV